MALGFGIRIYFENNREFMNPKLVLLGTGGGRHTTMFQARSTGGFLFMTDTGTIHIDPGPGALTNMCNIGYDLRKTDAVIISHCHPDHYSDASCVLEGMTHGGWVKRGALYGTESVITGKGNLGPCLSKYHLSISEIVKTIHEGDILDICGIKTEITHAEHSDPCNVGFKFHTKNGIISYVSDTSYSDEIADQYVGSRILLLPITTPTGNRIHGHMCTDDAIMFVNRVKPELTVFIHLGIVILKHDADSEAKVTAEATSCNVIAGRDLMCLELSEEINISDIPVAKPQWNSAWDL